MSSPAVAGKTEDGETARVIVCSSLQNVHLAHYTFLSEKRNPIDRTLYDQAIDTVNYRSR